MNIAYISSMFDSNIYNTLFKKSHKPGSAISKFHTMVQKGLLQNGVSVNAYSILPINRENCDKIRVHIPSQKENNFRLEYITLFNIPIIKNIQIMIKVFLKTLLLKKCNIVVYDIWIPSAAIGAIVSAKISRKKTVAIVTDSPKCTFKSGSMSLRIFDKILNFSDGYILLTEQMNEEANPKNKPYVVMEGLVDTEMFSMSRGMFCPSKKIVLYAGATATMYGIDTLCDAFIRCARPDEELHVYGNGDYKEKLIELSNTNKQIVYHGVCSNEEVVQAEMKATLLVNPRSSAGEYTKYSFPSKTMEYMASGTPALSAKLPGIPDEYDPYLFYFDGSDENGLEKALREILDMPTRVLAEKGKMAREFVLCKKNNVVQTKKIIVFCKNLLEQN